MNKYRRKQSKRIKKYMVILNSRGYNVTYRQAKKIGKRLNHLTDAWLYVARYPNLPFFGELARRLSASLYMIDETPIPICEELSMWTKENPFVPKYQSRPYKEETYVNVKQSGI